MNTDAHLHLYDFFLKNGSLPILENGNLLCASACRVEEFLWHESFAQHNPLQIVLSFGIHPQNPDASLLPFLESLIKDSRISAIGECGFDKYSPQFSMHISNQKKVWDAQLSLAQESGLPLIVHCRKAIDLLFADIASLRRLSAVVFHGWPGSAVEANSFLSKGVNAYFSIGKALLRGDRSLAQTIRSVPISRLLTETDAPYMTLKGEAFSFPSDIQEVNLKAAEIAGFDPNQFALEVAVNFKKVFIFSK